MNYQLFVDKLYKLFNVKTINGINLALDRVYALYQAFDYPCKNKPLIHVAGTNGKGSVSLKIAKAFEYSGYKVGLFTSPHLLSFRERFKVSSELISEDDVASLLDEIFQKMEALDIPATFFEVITILALLHFEKSEVDVAVIEVGLGGRLDATNIINPILSVITSISKDHENFLGNTLEKIAFEKAGIIKKGIPVVIGSNAMPDFMTEIASSRDSKVILASNAKDYDEENAETAKAALNYLTEYFPKIEAHIEIAIVERPKCRFEYLSKHNCILDVAHNEDGLKKLFKKLEGKSYHLAIALGANKDLQTIIKQLLSERLQVTFITSSHPRLSKLKELQNIAKQYSQSQHDISYLPIEDYLKTLPENTGLKVICGSHFIMAPILEYLGDKSPKDPIELNEN